MVAQMSSLKSGKLRPQSGGEGLYEAVTLRQYSPKHLKTLVGGASQSIHKDPSNFPTKNSGMWSPQQKR